MESSDPRANTRQRDTRLVESMAAGDESAVGLVFDQYGTLVYNLARRILGSDGDAEEVTQDVFVELWSRAKCFDASRGTLPGFLLTLTRTTAIDRLRYRKARPMAAMDAAVAGVDQRAMAPVEFASLDDARMHVSGALHQLPAEERRVLEMAYFEGLSQSEIAERTGAPLGTVKGRARNGLRRLRETLPAGLGGTIS